MAVLTFQEMNYTERLPSRRSQDGSMTYPHRLVDGSKAAEATATSRKTLAAQPNTTKRPIR